MKKIMIGILMLVPLLIVGSIMIASNVIQLNAYIAVDYIELNHETVSREDGFTMENNTFQLTASVFPKLAQNKNVLWEIESQEGFDENFDGDIAAVDENGLVTGYSYGVFTVLATSEDGVKQARCVFMLSSEELSGITVSGKDRMSVGEKQLLGISFSPIDALVTTVVWGVKAGSSEIIEVDENGIVTAIGAGEGTVVVMSGGVSKEFSISVSESGTKFGNEFFTARTEISLEELGLAAEDVSGISGGYIDGGNIVLENEVLTFTAKGHNVKISACGENDIIIENAEFLDYEKNSAYRAEVGGIKVVLKPFSRMP